MSICFTFRWVDSIRLSVHHSTFKLCAGSYYICLSRGADKIGECGICIQSTYSIFKPNTSLQAQRSVVYHIWYIRAYIYFFSFRNLVTQLQDVISKLTSSQNPQMSRMSTRLPSDGRPEALVVPDAPEPLARTNALMSHTGMMRTGSSTVKHKKIAGMLFQDSGFSPTRMVAWSRSRESKSLHRLRSKRGTSSIVTDSTPVLGRRRHRKPLPIWHMY